LAALVKVLLTVCGLVLGLFYRRYLGILGADRRKPAERQAYDALRNSLAEGNMAARLYAERLARFLDWVDRFFGDAGMADRTLFPHAFGLKTPAPLWTAPAMDRCLFLGLIYPIATIFLIWAISGHVGPAETALHLKAGLSGAQRALLSAGFGASMFGMLRTIQLVHTWKSILWFCVALALSVADVISGAGIASTAAMAVGVGAIVGALSSKAALGAIAVTGVVLLPLAYSVFDLWSTVRIPVFTAG
jgi:hypothetical protein